ncbi:MAG: Gp15 family bacteriophage protein [Treponema sp.]
MCSPRWHKFQALFKGLHDTKLNEIIGYRLYKQTGKKKSDYDRENRGRLLLLFTDTTETRPLRVCLTPNSQFNFIPSSQSPYPNTATRLL